VNRIKKIQNQGYLFLKDIKTLESALQLVSDSQLIVSVYLTEERYHLIICDRKERSEFDSYIATDLSYSEIPIPLSCEQITGIYARVKFEVDNLIGRLIDLPDTEAIVESGYNLNVYRIAEKSAIKPFFIISVSGAEFDIAPEERVRELLEQEVTLNRGYALSAWYGLCKYFDCNNPYPKFKPIIDIISISDNLVNRFGLSLSGYLVITFDRLGRKFVKDLGVATTALNWFENAIAIPNVEYDKTKYNLTKEQLQKEISTKYWEGYQDDSNHYN
jgi:hypothetical protein